MDMDIRNYIHCLYLCDEDVGIPGAQSGTGPGRWGRGGTLVDPMAAVPGPLAVINLHKGPKVSVPNDSPFCLP